MVSSRDSSVACEVAIASQSSSRRQAKAPLMQQQEDPSKPPVGLIAGGSEEVAEQLPTPCEGIHHHCHKYEKDAPPRRCAGRCCL